MAEFKLGRIKFVWQGDWVSAKTYYVDDVVRHGGRTYICVIGHTAQADFDNDLQNIPTRWNQLSDGQEWKSDWATSTVYKIGDLVKYGGYLYICTEGHTSAANTNLGLEANSSDWDLFAEGFDYKNDWTISTRYKINDIVKYGANSYVCNQEHISSATYGVNNSPIDGLEADQSKWTLYTEGLEWKTDWNTNVRYRVNDIVKYGGIVYVCNQGHLSASNFTNGLESDQSKWDFLFKGTEYRNDWDNNSIRYRVNDLVKYGGGIWICKIHHTSNVSVTFESEESNNRWERYIEGLEFDDNWDSSTIYQPGDIVRYGGYVYISKTNHSNKVPPDETLDWDLFTTGFKLQSDWNSSIAYKVGDVVRLNGYTYVAILGHTDEKPPNLTYWERLNSGFDWQGAWTDAREYVLGDVVRFTPSGGDPSSYVCILAHTSNTATNRPDVDGGVRWNLLVAGAEDTNLTTQGDLLYYSGSGPTRLEIGLDGQILASTGTLPAWAFWGTVSKLYYVAAHGVNEPGPEYGLSIDKPWKTVRYACEQIEKGAENQDAGFLLTMNRIFIQEEIIGWTDAEIAADAAPFTISFVYDKVFCKRDMGLIVDALVYDITHGGNTRTIAAAKAYFDNGTSYIVGQEAETIASINYGLSIIENVLDNISPTSSYSSYTQYIDLSYTSESGVKERVTELIAIITDAILAGNTQSLPKVDQPRWTISVKTGVYEEVLPILLPTFTAVVGDELRSTTIVPAGSIIDSGDRAKTIEALTYLRSITEDVITNTPVLTPPPYGSVPQVTTLDPGSVGFSANVTNLSNLMDEIVDILDNGEGAADAYSLPAPTGFGSSLTDVAYASTGNATGATTGYDDAVDQLTNNKNFIQAEITAWIAAQVAGNISPFTSSFTYNAAACERDVGYIVEAIIYDLTYGGNTQTTVAARAYYSYGESTFGEGEKEETLAAYSYLKDLVEDIILENPITKSSGNALDPDTSAAAGTQASANFAKERVQEIYDTIDNDGVLAAEISPALSWVDADLVESRNRFIRIKSDLQSDSVAWVRFNFPTLAFNLSTCSRDVGYILDAVGYDLMFGSNFASIKAGLSYYRGTVSAQLVVAEQKEATIGMLTFLKIKLTKYVANGAAVVADILWSYIIGYLTNPGTRPPVMGTNKPELDIDILAGARVLIANKDFFAEEAVEYIKDTYGSYTFNEEFCKRDVREFIDAIAYDITYNGNYRVILATRYYNNAAQGSKLEDMFYVKNAGGLRNMTFDGIDGSSDGNTTGQQDPLTPPNGVGTRRVKGGAYASLDPGWGPNDHKVWTNERSTYVQNITTFGIGAIGQKIDGAIHTGGNRSIVSNDFTQVISDGIGAWVTNNGLAELVSVFTYYAHVGYLADNGGKIRATNGNNSYGDFGAISEGVDVTETPITGKVDNRATEADIRNVYTDGNRILRFEYRNAGINYSEATFSISGSGANALAVLNNEIRDSGVFSVRLTDPGDSSGPGGLGYITAANLAQTGSNTEITLAATDINPSSAYVGMSIYIIAGTGGGQYGYIDTYNAGTKIATVRKESVDEPGWDHVIAGTPIAGTLDVTSSYVISPRLTFTPPPFSYNQTENTPIGDWSDIVYGAADGRYTNVSTQTLTGPGIAATFDIRRRDGIYTVTLNVAGANYAIGNTIRISGASLGGATPANDIIVTVTNIAGSTGNGPILDISYEGQAIPARFVAVAYDSSSIMTSLNGVDWTQGTISAVADWKSIAYGEINQIGYWVAVAENSNIAAYSINGIDWTSSTLPASADWLSITYGNERFVAVASGGSTSAYSTDGILWSSMSGLPSETWTSVTHGSNRFVAVALGTTTFAYSINGTTWLTGNMPVSAGWSSVTFGNNRYVAVTRGLGSDIEDSNIAAYSLNGLNWTQVELPKSEAWVSINYSQGIFYAVSPSKTSISSPDGILWTIRDLDIGTVEVTATSKDIIGTFTNRTLPVSGFWTDILWNDSEFIAIGHNNNDTGYIVGSTDASTWTSKTVSSAGGFEFVSISYNGVDKYIVLIFNTRNLLTSADGTTWTLQNTNGVNNFPAARTWTDSAYGDNKFVAIANVGANPVYYSTDAVTWTQGTMTTAAWSSVVYGDIGGTGYFVAVASGSNNIAYSTDGIAWITASNLPSSSAWSSITYNNGTFVAVAGDTGTATTVAAYSTDAINWTAATLPGSAANWIRVVHGGGTFMAFAYASNRTAVSLDGITWVEGPAISSGLWNTATYGSTGAVDNGKFVALRTNGSTVAAEIDYILDTNFITTTDSSVLSVGDIVEFQPGTVGGLASNIKYFVKSIPNLTSFTVSSTLNGTTTVLSTGSGTSLGELSKFHTSVAAGNPGGNHVWVALASSNGSSPGFGRSINVYQGVTAAARSYVSDDLLAEIWITEPGSGYTLPPTMTIDDPNNIGLEATFEVRLGDGVLANPTFINRGVGYTASSASLVGDGTADRFQEGSLIAVQGLNGVPIAGSNLQIAGIDDVYYRIVNITNLVGNAPGPFSAIFQVSPAIGNLEAPEHLTGISIRRRYSQVRLTGHDFLDIGTGNKTQTNYPGLPFQPPIPANETVDISGGRVFYTSTDQDGNFRVGGLFNVEQATGVATLNADAFNIAGLQELQLGSVALGGAGATITEFSTDPFFTADSDNIVPTQRAIKAYITSQIGGGQSSLNVNTLTAGVIFIAGNTITTTTGSVININTKVNFTGGVDGSPVALNYFLR
jgi:hypothetical protein